MFIMIVSAEVTEEQVVQTIHDEVLWKVDEDKKEDWSGHSVRVTNSQHEKSCGQREDEKSWNTKLSS